MTNRFISYDNLEIQAKIKENNASESEAQFISNIQKCLQNSQDFASIISDENLESIKSNLDISGFFSFLKQLDNYLLGDSSIEGRLYNAQTGYFSKEELDGILTYLFIQRYVNAHDEDNKTEKIKEAALQDFISDKYDSGVHFFEEILQNIDDAIGRKNKKNFETDKENQIEIKWNGKEIIFSYPDRGFSFYDLMAITSLGNSIKKGDIDQASIGEKGIGFKSVFSVATKISIQSKFFGFDIEYDKNRKTSVLQPSKIYTSGCGKQTTILTIFFDEKFDIDSDTGFKKELRKWLFENSKENYFNYSPFLFLKNVSEIIYNDGESEDKVIIKRNSVTNEFSITNINDYCYLIYKKSLNFNKNLIENRWGKIAAIVDKDDSFSIDRPVEIAFPVDTNNTICNGDGNSKKGLFYSYLPTEMVIDFPIYINVDVHLKSSRGRISESDFKDGSEWNKNIYNNLPEILKDAYLGIINLYSNSCNYVEQINKVAEQLYEYVKKQTTQHYFSEKLKIFYTNILDEAIYLNSSNQFVKKNNIWLSGFKNESEWNDFVDFCLNAPFPECNNINQLNLALCKQYSKNYKWYLFTKGTTYISDKWREECLSKYRGIKNFYENTFIQDKQKKNKIILNVLKNINSISDSDKNTLLFLFLEDNNNYTIGNKQQISDNGKVIFFHTNNDAIENDGISTYISKVPFDYGVENKEQSSTDYDKYKTLLKGIIDEKDWKAYIENILCKINSETNTFEEKSFSVYDYFNSCCRYLKFIDIDDISKISVPKEVKNKFCKYVLPSKNWNDLESKSYPIYRQVIAKYLEDEENDNFGYQLFDFSKVNDFDENNKENIYKYVKFLMNLGIKCCPDTTNFQNDKLSIAIIPNYNGIDTDPISLDFIYPGDKYYKYLSTDKEIKDLQKYFVELVNGKYSEFQSDIVDIFENKGLNFKKILFIPKEILSRFTVSIQLEGPNGGTSNYPCCNHKIYSFSEVANEDVKYFVGDKDVLNINSGELLFANQDKYACFVREKWEKEYTLKATDYNKGKRYSDRNEKIIKKIITSVPKDMLDRLRWTIIWNKVFSKKYAWYEAPLQMKSEDFISYYKYLERSDIVQLLPKGYSIEWEKGDYIAISDENILSILTDYINNEFNLNFDEKEFSKYYCLLMNKEIEMCISLEEYDKLHNKNYSYFIAINETNTPRTDYISMILKSKGQKVSDIQKFEIADIVGEIKDEKRKRIIGLKREFSCFTEAVFRDDNHMEIYDKMIEASKDKLPSVWKKSSNNASKTIDWGMKEWLCEPFEIKVEKENFIFQGYGYQCPICGSIMHHHSLSGIKYIKRIKNTDQNNKDNLPYLYFISCLNCADMIERADKVMIKDYDGKSLKEVLNHFQTVCYCADKFHIFNHSKMKTMKLYLEIDNHEFMEQIKVSFLHMILLLKLWKDI